MAAAEALRDLLARMERVLIDDEAVAKRESGMRELDAIERQCARRDRLAAEAVPLDPLLHRAIVTETGLKATSALDATQRWLRATSAKPVLVLSGGTGCGKSVASAWAIASTPGGGKWRTASAVCRAFASQFGDGVEDQELLRATGLLVIDDVGTEHAADRMSAALVELVEYRRARRTVVTTNLDKRAFAARYPDERLISRMRAHSVWVNDKGADLRGGK